MNTTRRTKSLTTWAKAVATLLDDHFELTSNVKNLLIARLSERGNLPRTEFILDDPARANWRLKYNGLHLRTDQLNATLAKIPPP